jgi:hypothetical protein
MSNSLSNAINIQKSRERDRTPLLKVQIQNTILSINAQELLMLYVKQMRPNILNGKYV